MITNCLNCNKEIEAIPSKIKNGKAKYCSKECRTEFRKNIISPLKGIKTGRKPLNPFKKGESSWNKGKKYTEKEKKNLNLEGLKIGQGWNKGKDAPWAKENPQIFKIGHTPKLKGKKNIKMSGENNPSWKGGISSLNNQIRTCLEYVLWRKEIFERDCFTCINCNHKGGNINADHIKCFSLIIKENKINTLEEALLCQELWDINNGQTLCIDCHKDKTKKDLKLINGYKI